MDNGKNAVQKSNSQTVSQSRALVTAVYDLNIPQKRILYLMMLSTNRHRVKRSSNGSIICSILVRDYAEIFDVALAQASRELSKNIKAMNAKEVVFLNPEEDYDDLCGETGIAWFSKRVQSPKRGLYEVYVNPEIEEHIRGLDTRYMYLSLLDVKNFTNEYVNRIYEHIRMHHQDSKKDMYIGIEYMFSRFSLPASYRRMSDLRRRVLNLACVEITKNTPFKLLDSEGKPNYQEVGGGTRVPPTGILFKYKYLPSKEKVELTDLERQLEGEI